MVKQMRDLAARLDVYADAVMKMPEPPVRMVEDMRAASHALGVAAQSLDESGVQLRGGAAGKQVKPTSALSSAPGM